MYFFDLCLVWFLCQIYTIDIAPWWCSSIHSCGLIVSFQRFQTGARGRLKLAVRWEYFWLNLEVLTVTFEINNCNKTLFLRSSCFSLCTYWFCVTDGYPISFLFFGKNIGKSSDDKGISMSHVHVYCSVNGACIEGDT